MKIGINPSKLIMEFLKNKYNLIFSALLIFVISIRLQYQFVDSVWPDEAHYMWVSHYALSQPTYLFAPQVFELMSFFPHFIMMIFDIFTTTFIAGRLVALLYSIVGIILIYLVGKEISNRFVGLIAAILLSFNAAYTLIGTKAIFDIPLAVMFLFVSYALLKLEKHKLKLSKKIKPLIKNNIWPILFTLGILVSFVTKGAAIILFLSLIIYFLITRKSRIIKDKKFLLTMGPIFLILILGSMIFKLISGKFLLYKFIKYSLDIRSVGEPLLVIKSLPSIIGSNYFTVLFAVGMFFCLLYHQKKHIWLLSWLWVFLIYFTLAIGTTIPRYYLPILPVIFIFAGIGVDELRAIINKLTKLKINRMIYLLVVILLAIPLYNNSTAMLENKAYTYSGFSEAGDWLNDNVDPSNSIIYAGSPQAIRLFTDFDYISGVYGEWGSDDGIIYYGYPEDRQVFEDQIINSDKTIYLEIDVWEWKNQYWVYPITQEKIGYLQSLGFEIVNIILKQAPTEQGLAEVPVVLILVK